MKIIVVYMIAFSSPNYWLFRVWRNCPKVFLYLTMYDFMLANKIMYCAA